MTGTREQQCAKKPGCRGNLVRVEGLEPPRLAAPEPKSGASANFATPATARVLASRAGLGERARGLARGQARGQNTAKPTPASGAPLPDRPATATLRQIGGPTVPPEGPLCLALAHNEGRLIADFLDHHRGLGCTGFLIVDDRSTDQTRAVLQAAPDVMLFEPVEGSTYREHKRTWRAELLDAHAQGRWVVPADVDERLVWRDVEHRPLSSLIADLQAEGAEAMFCTMVDMYRPGGLDVQAFDGSGPITSAIRHFDDPARDPLACRMYALPRRFAARWPTPEVGTFGGARDRLFYGGAARFGPLRRALARLFSPVRSPVLTPLSRLRERALRSIFAPRKGRLTEINLTKLGLIRWKRGSMFYGGPHSVKPAYRLSRETGVLLHYAFAAGAEGIAYIAERGQHDGGSGHYKTMLGAARTGAVARLDYAGTSEFTCSQVLSAFFAGNRER